MSKTEKRILCALFLGAMTAFVVAGCSGIGSGHTLSEGETSTATVVRFDLPTGQRYLRVSDCGVRYDVVAPPGTAATHAVGTGHVEVGRMIAVDVRPKAEVGRMIGADVRPSAGPAPDRMAVGRDRNRAGTTVGSCSLALYEG